MSGRAYSEVQDPPWKASAMWASYAAPRIEGRVRVRGRER
jgi:hypothetical protein